jgi:hypothetical protein
MKARAPSRRPVGRCQTAQRAVHRVQRCEGCWICPKAAASTGDLWPGPLLLRHASSYGSCRRRSDAFGRFRERRTTRRGRDPDPRFSAKRSRAREGTGRGGDLSAGGVGSDACFHARPSHKPARRSTSCAIATTSRILGEPFRLRRPRSGRLRRCHEAGEKGGCVI